MTIKRINGDPRTNAQKQADTLALAAIERGEFLRSTPEEEKAAIEHVMARYNERNT